MDGGFGDSQSLKTSPGEHPQQPIESSHLAQLEQRLLQKALQRAGGNLSQAARNLGITRPQLAYRLKKEGIPAA